MSRSVAWRHSCPVKVKERLDHASTARLYILHQTGPTGFHIKEEGKDRKLKVTRNMLLFNFGIQSSNKIVEDENTTKSPYRVFMGSLSIENSVEIWSKKFP